MSVHVLYDSSKRKSVMFCSTDGLAFGPIFDNEDAADFADWMLEHDRDPRDLTPIELLSQISWWRNTIDADAYAPSDPKNPAYHSTHADIWDAREGK